MSESQNKLKAALKLINANIGKIEKSVGAGRLQEWKQKYVAASGEVNPALDLFSMLCSGSTVSAVAFVETFDTCIKAGWTFPAGLHLHYFSSLAPHFLKFGKINDAVGMAYTDSVEVRALAQCGLQSDFINQFVSNTIQNLVLTCANAVPARDKASSSPAGREDHRAAGCHPQGGL